MVKYGQVSAAKSGHFSQRGSRILPREVSAISLLEIGYLFGQPLYTEESEMKDKDHLYILWTNADPVTADKMVFMYAFNGLKKGWWKEVTVVIWGATALLAAENPEVQAKIKELLAGGVEFTACKACADQLGVTEKLEALGSEVKYWGQPLTELLKDGAYLLTI